MLKHLSLEAFGQTVASDKAVPGGGCVAALAGALAAALTAMVARLTLKKENFAAVADQMIQLREDADQIQIELMDAVDQDAESYRQVLAAYRLPKTTEEDRQARSQAIEAAFKQAARVPLQVAETTLSVMDLAGRVAVDGNPDMVTDAAVGVLMARSAVLGALMNVQINLRAMEDPAFVARLKERLTSLKEAAQIKEKAIIESLGL